MKKSGVDLKKTN